MSEYYNPVIRMFGRYRTTLCASAGLPRGRITPAVRLDALIPPSRRRSVWAALRAAGLRVPLLELSTTARCVCSLLAITVIAGIGLAVGRWWPAALVVIPVWYVTFRASRPWATILPPFVRTVGELTMYGTRFREHVSSGYSWSHGDVTLKVRLIVAEALGLPLEQVRPETTFVELESC
ncbi:hypothetical protein PX52LOC_06793 [Limnoglobus roseus]|uniref:Uncharacterized protein n=1 Tax=Limnoglobus roseus TaxID=2598579 RepID=A0A5C1AR89_9BACT|nr:hypothetical protein PX52LOC_06793 [Limnoglobus roseus]